MARKKTTELLELDEHGNVIGILESARAADELIAEARAEGRTLTLRAGAPDAEPHELELMRLHDGEWKDATDEHRDRIEEARAEAEAEPPRDRKLERIRELAGKTKRSEAQRDELLNLLIERLGVI